MRTQLSTWDGKYTFEYEHQDDGTITYFYGDTCEYSRVLKSPLYDQLVQAFAGKTVRLNHCLEMENIEDWLSKNGIKTRITQYLAPILRHEGYIVEGTKKGKVTFR